jgi:hypothetical protein
MARHRDSRSPSPVGSSYSGSKRSRRDDESYRRKCRSRSPAVSFMNYFFQVFGIYTIHYRDDTETEIRIVREIDPATEGIMTTIDLHIGTIPEREGDHETET